MRIIKRVKENMMRANTTCCMGAQAHFMPGAPVHTAPAHTHTQVPPIPSLETHSRAPAPPHLARGGTPGA